VSIYTVTTEQSSQKTIS